MDNDPQRNEVEEMEAENNSHADIPPPEQCVRDSEGQLSQEELARGVMPAGTITWASGRRRRLRGKQNVNQAVEIANCESKMEELSRQTAQNASLRAELKGLRERMQKRDKSHRAELAEAKQIQATWPAGRQLMRPQAQLEEEVKMYKEQARSLAEQAPRRSFLPGPAAVR